MMGRIYMDTQDGLLGVSAVRTVDSGFRRNDESYASILCIE